MRRLAPAIQKGGPDGPKAKARFLWTPGAYDFFHTQNVFAGATLMGSIYSARLRPDSS
jgi:hypothetical protein